MNTQPLQASDMEALGHVQGSVPDLLTYLLAAYKAQLQRRIDERVVQSGPASVRTLDEALTHAPVLDFMRFALEFLAENRPAETFPVDANIEIRLSNGDLVLICPGTQLSGTMQASHSVQIAAQGKRGGMQGDGGAIGI